MNQLMNSKLYVKAFAFHCHSVPSSLFRVQFTKNLGNFYWLAKEEVTIHTTVELSSFRKKLNLFYSIWLQHM